MQTEVVEEIKFYIHLSLISVKKHMRESNDMMTNGQNKIVVWEEDSCWQKKTKRKDGWS